MKNSAMLHIVGVAAVTLLCACGGEEKKEAKDHVAQAEVPAQVAEVAPEAQALASAEVQPAATEVAQAPAAPVEAPAAPAAPAEVK